jgi:hypothetical protein
MATTTAWEPKASAQALIRSRFSTAAVFTEILSAPASSSRRASSTLRMPPPTDSGMKQTSAVRATTSRMVPRFSWLAVMSRNISSSAPAAS